VTSTLPPQMNRLFQMACRAAQSFVPLSEAEKEFLKAEAAKENSIFEYPAWPA